MNLRLFPMRHSIFLSSLFVTKVFATRLIESNSLTTCMDNSAVAASSFQTIFFPGNQTVSFAFEGTSHVASNVTLQVNVIGYGYDILSLTLNPCAYPGLTGICPMRASNLPLLHSNFQLPENEVKKIPDIVYFIPDIDAIVRVWINETATRKPLACLETRLSNGKTVQHGAVAWVLGGLSVFGLMASAILFEKGYVFAPSKVAAKVMLLVQYYQSLAQLGMIPFKTPPLVESWTQNFQWSMGIIRVPHLQTLCRWYQRSTGGNPSVMLSALSKASVRVLRRSNAAAFSVNQKAQSVRGIERVSFKSNFEITNLFTTALVWLCICIMLLSIIMIGSKLSCGKIIKSHRFKPLHWCGPLWQTYFKGSVFRLLILWFVPITLLCSWEMLRVDSNVIKAVAVLLLLDTVFLLGFAIFKIVNIAKASCKTHHSHAFLLFGNENFFGKWGFLFSEYRGCCCYFLVPRFSYLLLKSLFISTTQQAPVVTVVAVFILDLAYFTLAVIFRPHLDFTLNMMAIAVISMTLLNSTLLLLFSNLFGVPALVIGLCGIIFFFANVLFLVVVLSITTGSIIRSLFAKNADRGYVGVKDDRSSFTKSHAPAQTDELTALGVTARGEMWPTMRDSSPHGSQTMIVQALSSRKAIREKSPRYPADWVPGG